MHPDRERWNKKHREGTGTHGPTPRLQAHWQKLTRGRAIDLACGKGGNAAFLAERGWTAFGVDLSDVGLARASVPVVLADLDHFHFRNVDTIVCTYYLHHGPLARWLAALNPGGTIFYEAFTTEHLRTHPQFRPEFCFKPGELRDRLSGFELLHYEESADADLALVCALARRPA